MLPERALDGHVLCLAGGWERRRGQVVRVLREVVAGVQKPLLLFGQLLLKMSDFKPGHSQEEYDK